MALSDDLPIEFPVDDRFGLDPFAAAIAASIAGMTAHSGMVLAVNGSWGAGKSSAINLIRHHLKAAIEAGDVTVVTFNPWWFAGSDALTLAFLQELNKAIGPSLPAKVRKSLARIGKGVSAIGAVAGAIANLKAPGLGSIVSGITDLFGRATGGQRTVDEEHRLVVEALSKQKRRFLIVIDDIDRLNPDDAITIFRLVKSVGRLPNLIYLLAFDRQIAERIVSERFPSEGPSYLEKIIQGAFELPLPQPDLLRQEMLTSAVEIIGEPTKQADVVRFMNIFHDVVAPTIRTPRDVVRLSNHLSATWPAVAGNVNRADFLALTALQLAEPLIYDAIRFQSRELCGAGERSGRRTENVGQEYDRLLAIADRPERERLRLRVALRRLFPRLDSIWGNLSHDSDLKWRRDRLLASAEHFPSYFAFAVSDDVVPVAEMEALIENAGNPDLVRSTFRKALTHRRRTGSTLAALLLEELTVYAADVQGMKVPSLTSTLSEIADELDVDNDVVHGLWIGNNPLRLNWLLNRLVNDRFEILERETIYVAAIQTAPVGWACDIAERCLSYFEPRSDGRGLGDPIVSQEVAEEFRATALAKLGNAAADGTLAKHRRITRLMFTWLRLNGNDPAPVRLWTDAGLGEDNFVVALANAIPNRGWAHSLGWGGMGDRVSRPSVTVDFEPYDAVLDVARFEQRIAEILAAGTLDGEELSQLEAFLRLPRGSHGGGVREP